MVTATPIPILSDNYVWVCSRSGSQSAVIVDPGEAGPVEAYLRASNLKCDAVFLTHHHADHVDGAAELGTLWNCPVYGPRDEDISAVTNPVCESETIDSAHLAFDIWSIPGHTRAHVAYVGHGLVFCGDTLFAGGCGRIFEGTPAEMYASLTRLAGLDLETLVCCAHEYTVANLEFARSAEPDNTALRNRLEWARATRSTNRPTLPSRLKDELATNPFLRCHGPEVILAASEKAGRALEPGLEVFTEIRRWKDGFRAR
jgi:hydroxyacylglutathione hydrolase